MILDVAVFIKKKDWLTKEHNPYPWVFLFKNLIAYFYINVIYKKSNNYDIKVFP